MVNESDKRPETRLSATDASRTFSKLLDEVESGRRFVIHRRGRDICTISPATKESRRVSECIAILRERAPVLLDGRLGDDLIDLISIEPEERPSWDS